DEPRLPLARDEREDRAREGRVHDRLALELRQVRERPPRSYRLGGRRHLVRHARWFTTVRACQRGQNAGVSDRPTLGPCARRSSGWTCTGTKACSRTT